MPWVLRALLARFPRSPCLLATTTTDHRNILKLHFRPPPATNNLNLSFFSYPVDTLTTATFGIRNSLSTSNYHPADKNNGDLAYLLESPLLFSISLVN